MKHKCQDDRHPAQGSGLAVVPNSVAGRVRWPRLAAGQSEATEPRKEYPGETSDYRARLVLGGEPPPWASGARAVGCPSQWVQLRPGLWELELILAADGIGWVRWLDDWGTPPCFFC